MQCKDTSVAQLQENTFEIYDSVETDAEVIRIKRWNHGSLILIGEKEFEDLLEMAQIQIMLRHWKKMMSEKGGLDVNSVLPIALADLEDLDSWMQKIETSLALIQNVPS